MPIATIPEFSIPPLTCGPLHLFGRTLGPLEIQSFGVLTALGILLAVKLAMRGAKEQGRDPAPIVDFAMWGVLGGVLMGHIVHVLAYHPDELYLWTSDGRFNWDILKIWVGLSSMGGLFGGIIAAIAYFRFYARIPFAPYSDAFALGIAPGWGLARVGCFTVHDHPGVESNFFLAVVQRGSPRHDLGLYEAILLFAIGALLWTLHRRKLLRGRLLPLLGVLYGAPRFFLDFLRARPGEFYANGDPIYADGRHFGLTFAQFFAIALVVYGVFRLATFKAAGEAPRQKRAAAG
jgi:phosphatidylglycerol:prolipoprotein diacylglycerol transferase